MRSHPDVECAALAANASAERRAAIKLMKEMGLRPEERAYELQNWPETGRGIISTSKRAEYRRVKA